MELKAPKKNIRQKAFITIFIAALIIRLALVWCWPNNEPYDGVVYSQIAKNVLERGVYSMSTVAPFAPTYIRVPGYPLFLAGIYAIFGHQNDTAVRLVQALIDSLTTALTAYLAVLWLPDKWKYKKAKTGLIALGLAAFTPFTIIYAATILAETLTMFLLVLFAVLISKAVKRPGGIAGTSYLIIAGIIGGLMALVRPDSGLFVLAGGLTLLFAAFYPSKPELAEQRQTMLRKLILFIRRALTSGFIFTLGFLIVLLPWIARNYRVFRTFMPLAPYSASMPDEFVAAGYDKWISTWAQNDRYVDYAQWSLDASPITVDNLPAYAFDSASERTRVAGLLDLYNNPDPDDASGDPAKMTPAIDAAFTRIAEERKDRNPIRFYVLLPLKRASALWFDTHSQYYPFSGYLFPIENLKQDVPQMLILPIFSLLIWFLTLSALAGLIILWRQKGDSRIWVLFFVFLVFPRLVFLSFLSHPEPRYTVEYFPLLIAAGAIALAALSGKDRPKTNKPA